MPLLEISSTISRIGCSIDAAGGIEPWRPTVGSPFMYPASGSLTPYGGTYFMAFLPLANRMRDQRKKKQALCARASSGLKDIACLGEHGIASVDLHRTRFQTRETRPSPSSLRWPTKRSASPAARDTNESCRQAPRARDRRRVRIAK